MFTFSDIKLFVHVVDKEGAGQLHCIPKKMLTETIKKICRYNVQVDYKFLISIIWSNGSAQASIELSKNSC